MPLRSNAKAARFGGLLLLAGACLAVLAVSYAPIIEMLRS